MLTALSAFWFEQHAATSSPTTCVSATDVPGRGARPRAARAASSRCCPLECVVRGYLPARAGRTTSAPAGLRHRAAGRPARGRAAARADLHAGDQGRASEPRREHRLRRGPPSSSATGALIEELRERLARAVRVRAPSTPRERGIILADTKFEFGLDADGALVLADEVLTPDSSRFWPADEYEPGAAAAVASTSSTCATGSTRSAGTRRRPAPRAARRGRRGHARRATSRPTSGSPASRSTRLARRASVPHEGDASSIRPEGGHPRPAGPGGRARAAGARLRRRRERPRRQADRARASTATPTARPSRARCASGCSPTR